MKRNKFGFKSYISKSLPLPTTKNTVVLKGTLKKNDLVFYYNTSEDRRVYGELQFIEDENVWCLWERQGRHTSYGYMPINTVFVDDPNGDSRGVPIINLQLSPGILVHPG